MVSMPLVLPAGTASENWQPGALACPRKGVDMPPRRNRAPVRLLQLAVLGILILRLIP